MVGINGYLVDLLAVDLRFICWSLSSGGLRFTVVIVGFMIEIAPYMVVDARQIAVVRSTP